jgi:hypothetical protein
VSERALQRLANLVADKPRQLEDRQADDRGA